MVGMCVASKKLGEKIITINFPSVANKWDPINPHVFMEGSSRPKPQNFGWIHDFHDTSGSTWSPDPSGHLPPHHLWARLHPGQPGWRGTAGCRRGGAIGEVAHVVFGDGVSGFLLVWKGPQGPSKVPILIGKKTLIFEVHDEPRKSDSQW